MRNSSVSLGCIHTHSVMWNCRASLGDVPCASQQLSPGSWDANTAERELLPPPQQLTPDNQRGGGGAGSWLLLLPENQWGRGAELAPGSSSRQRPSGEGAELTPGSSSRQRPSGGGSGAGSCGNDPHDPHAGVGTSLTCSALCLALVWTDFHQQP